MTRSAADASSRPRPVRSFVLRQGRMSRAQRRAYDTLWERFCIPFAPAVLNLAAAFGRRAPTVLEIGFGMGETTAAIAAAHPHLNYLGVEVHSPGVGSLLKRAEALALTNLRIIQHDAVEVLQHMIAPDSLVAAHVFFPDPWPKKRHHKRRLIQPAFVSLLAACIVPRGYLHLATDWGEYADQMLRVLSAEPRLANCAQGFAPRPAHRPLTKFERRGLSLGYAVWDLVFQRTSMPQGG